MTERETTPRDPRTAREMEQIFPSRMWVIARQAAEHGWDITIRPTEIGWALYLTEDHHCVHIHWQPNTNGNRDRYPWDLTRAKLKTRCRSGGTVHVKTLPEWLANHPDECLKENTRRPLAHLPRIDGCDDHVISVASAGFWPRHDPPPVNVKGLVSYQGDLWTPCDDGGHYWRGPGWPEGVAWNTLRQWTSLRTATDRELAELPPPPLPEDPFMKAVAEAAENGATR